MQTIATQKIPTPRGEMLVELLKHEVDDTYHIWTTESGLVDMIDKDMALRVYMSYTEIALKSAA